MQQLLSQMASGGAAQMGDLSGLARGEVTLSPQSAALIQQIQQLTMNAARKQAKGNYEDMVGSVEGAALDSGLDGSSIEAVNRAVLGRQLQQTLDQSTLQGQITSAQQMRTAAVEDAGLQLNANQLLLQRILGSAAPLAQMGLQERLAQATTTQKSKQGVGLGSLAQVGGLVLGGMTGGASTAATAAAGGLRGNDPSDWQDIGTGRNPADYG